MARWTQEGNRARGSPIRSRQIGPGPAHGISLRVLDMRERTAALPPVRARRIA
jgi:hypothetical protein